MQLIATDEGIQGGLSTGTTLRAVSAGPWGSVVGACCWPGGRSRPQPSTNRPSHGPDCSGCIQRSSGVPLHSLPLPASLHTLFLTALLCTPLHALLLTAPLYLSPSLSPLLPTPLCCSTLYLSLCHKKFIQLGAIGAREGGCLSRRSRRSKADL